MKREEAERRLREVLRRKHYRLSTEESYVGWVKRYCAFLAGHRRKEDAPERKIEAYLTTLATDGKSAVSQNQAYHALRFFYEVCLGVKLGDIQALRAKTGSRVRFCPTREQVARLLPLVPDLYGYPANLMVRLLYGCGMRVSEAPALRIKDVDLVNSRVIIREAKHNKDRVVALPCSVLAEIEAEMRVAQRTWQTDRGRGLPVQLPDSYGKKNPAARFAWSWAFLFPAAKPCQHPRTGEMVRYHVLPEVLQRAVKMAARQIGEEANLTPHCLRHAYATHALEMQMNPRAVQAAMGHKSLETTMGYLHAEALSVRSPMDALPRVSGVVGASAQMPEIRVGGSVDRQFPVRRVTAIGEARREASQFAASTGISGGR